MHSTMCSRNMKLQVSGKAGGIQTLVIAPLHTLQLNIASAPNPSDHLGVLRFDRGSKNGENFDHIPNRQNVNFYETF